MAFAASRRLQIGSLRSIETLHAVLGLVLLGKAVLLHVEWMHLGCVALQSRSAMRHQGSLQRLPDGGRVHGSAVQQKLSFHGKPTNFYKSREGSSVWHSFFITLSPHEASTVWHPHSSSLVQQARREQVSLKHSRLISSATIFTGYDILALTRDASGSVSQRFAKLPRVRVVVKDHKDIDAAWLRQHEVKRSFIAAQTPPSHFAEETQFNIALLQAGVEYHVRIGTAPMNMRGVHPAYGFRNHWAVEQQLQRVGFQAMHWTSIRPNLFMEDYLKNAVDFVKEYRRTGKQGTLRMAIAADKPFPVIHPADVGVIVAHLLVGQDTASYDKGLYSLNGPEDTTGLETLKLVEEAIGTKVEDVVYKDPKSIFEWAVEGAIVTGYPRSLLDLTYIAFDGAWNGEWRDWPTAAQLLELEITLQRCADVFEKLIAA
jgi:uncharacterized protein YbjT (DUF2867 family)